MTGSSYGNEKLKARKKWRKRWRRRRRRKRRRKTTSGLLGHKDRRGNANDVEDKQKKTEKEGNESRVR